MSAQKKIVQKEFKFPNGAVYKCDSNLIYPDSRTNGEHLSVKHSGYSANIRGGEPDVIEVSTYSEHCQYVFFNRISKKFIKSHCVIMKPEDNSRYSAAFEPANMSDFEDVRDMLPDWHHPDIENIRAEFQAELSGAWRVVE